MSDTGLGSGDTIRTKPSSFSHEAYCLAETDNN